MNTCTCKYVCACAHIKASFVGVVRKGACPPLGDIIFPMAGSVVELVDLTTQERRQARLVGFDVRELDVETLNAVFG